MSPAITAYERIKEEYRVRPEEMPFEWYVEKHLESGFVFSRPDVFLACRPVVSDSPELMVTSCDYRFPWEICDCWYVSMLAGNLARAWEFMPWFLPLMCFQRANDPTKSLRFYKTESLQRLTLKISNFQLNYHATA